ncbi:hypothetical protein [Rhodocyclus tenuis]|uniref:Uncharacterized protein n=1 Tax=Rhodocyclus tenuis TaxID=1066 RepID=A0A840GD73_RHOTE|nr:hypothetical protein [Rhodocyclus tenuis]MBB4246189.1 hypothetical protein [Rhodocyclus tenuis]
MKNRKALGSRVRTAGSSDDAHQYDKRQAEIPISAVVFDFSTELRRNPEESVYNADLNQWSITKVIDGKKSFIPLPGCWQ